MWAIFLKLGLEIPRSMSNFHNRLYVTGMFQVYVKGIVIATNTIAITMVFVAKSNVLYLRACDFPVIFNSVKGEGFVPLQHSPQESCKFAKIFAFSFI